MVLAGATPVVSEALSSSAAALSTISAASAQTGGALLAAASASLALGEGPAGGASLNCLSSVMGLSASCSASSPPGSTSASPTAAPGNIGSQKWEPETPPDARASASMAYDGKDRYVVLFGGSNGTDYQNDTWEFTHNMWVELASSKSPSPRANASLTYDAADRYVVLFGGYNGAPLGDTWKFVGGEWTLLSVSSSPSPREDATMTYDPRDGYTVLFGGQSGHKAYGDTWMFLGGTWTRLTPSTAPSARWASASTFDAADNYVLLFGGYDGTKLLGDTWEFAGGSWSPLSPSVSPSPRYESGMAFDTAVNKVILFGGAGTSITGWYADGDTWSYVGGVWKQIVPAPGVSTPGLKSLPYGAPAARQAFGMTYSTQGSSVVLFGGLVDGDPIQATPAPNTQTFGATDTWSYTAAGWSQVQSESQFNWAQLPGRVGAAIAFDPTASYKIGTTTKTGYAVAFGGSTAYGPNGETWIFLSYPSAVWSETFPVHSPSARSYAAMVYDVRDNYVLLFGGMSPTGAALGDTWTFQNGNWTQLSPSASPLARYGAMMEYDQADGYVLLFGGTDGTYYYSDTWTFQGDTWTQLPTTKAPSPRAFGGLAWDNKTGYTALFGGTSGHAALGDTWKYLGGSWTQLKLTSPLPPAAWGMSFLNNGKSSDVFMFGGCTTPSFNPLSPSCPAASTLGTPWHFRSSWSIVPAHPRLTAIPAAPQARFLASAVYDLHAPANVVLLFDGMTSSGAWASDRWVFQSNIWNPWAPPVQPLPTYGAASAYDDRSQDMLMFGGIGELPTEQTAFLNATWQWDTGSWGQDNPPVTPSPRAFSSLAYFGTMIELHAPASYNYSVLFGGVGPSGYLSDTWRWVGSPVGGTWTQVHPATPPSARANASMAYDPTINKLVLFGGENGAGYLGDTWVFSTSGQWSQLFPSASPSPRASAAMTFDAEDGYMLLFGGAGSGGALGGTWEFTGSTWVQLSPSSAPAPRYGAGIIDCPVLVPSGPAHNPGEPQVVLLVAGTNGSDYFADTWAFLGGQWTLLPSTTPGLVPFAFGMMSNDLDDGHASVYGGLSAYGILGGFWEFKQGS